LQAPSAAGLSVGVENDIGTGLLSDWTPAVRSIRGGSPPGLCVCLPGPNQGADFPPILLLRGEPGGQTVACGGSIVADQSVLADTIQANGCGWVAQIFFSLLPSHLFRLGPGFRNCMRQQIKQQSKTISKASGYSSSPFPHCRRSRWFLFLSCISGKKEKEKKKSVLRVSLSFHGCRSWQKDRRKKGRERRRSRLIAGARRRVGAS